MAATTTIPGATRSFFAYRPLRSDGRVQYETTAPRRGQRIAGGALGYFGFELMLKQGYYGMVLPGGLLGLGAGIGKNRWLWLAILCGIAALALGLFTEWHLVVRFQPIQVWVISCSTFTNLIGSRS